MSLKYFFILGNNPTLSTAEISAVFTLEKKYLVNQSALILTTNTEINSEQIIKKLGGTIKIGIILKEIKFLQNSEQFCTDLVSFLLSCIKKDNKVARIKFGISCYSDSAQKNSQIFTRLQKYLGMQIKKRLQSKGINCRWVTSKQTILSSVVVEQNKLINKGIEIVFVHAKNQIFIGKTLAVQPFKDLSFRDYNRPARDDYSGMLPPKLAQIMINLASEALYHSKTINILDPFCGSGTILTEAMMMGYKNLIGSDVSKDAIKNTEQNIKWIKNNYQLKINYQLFNKNVLKLSQFIKPYFIDAIITEPYLGPQRGRINFQKIIQELEKLYSKTLHEFRKILKPNRRIVMIWPIFRNNYNFKQIIPDLNSFKIINPIPIELRQNSVIKLTNRNTIIYGRQMQKIWREIVILKHT